MIVGRHTGNTKVFSTLSSVPISPGTDRGDGKPSGADMAGENEGPSVKDEESKG